MNDILVLNERKMNGTQKTHVLRACHEQEIKLFRNEKKNRK